MLQDRRRRMAWAMAQFPCYVDVLSADVPQPRRISTGLTGLVLH